MAYSVIIIASHAVLFYHCWGQQCQKGEMCKRVICIYDKNMFDKNIFDKNISFTPSGFDPLILRLAVSARNHCAMESPM